MHTKKIYIVAGVLALVAIFYVLNLYLSLRTEELVDPVSVEKHAPVAPTEGNDGNVSSDPSDGVSVGGTQPNASNAAPEPAPIVVKDFEGEADPARMTLAMKPWVWIATQLPSGSSVVPKKPGIFALTFDGKGGVSVKTDCNSMGGNYKAGNGTLVFSEMMQTEMYCEGSQESDFASMLADTSGYHFTSKGELILDLKFDSGSVILR